MAISDSPISSAPVTSSAVPTWVLDHSDTLGAGDSDDYLTRLGIAISEGLGVGDSETLDYGLVFIDLVETVGLSDAVSLAVSILLSDGVGIGDAVSMLRDAVIYLTDDTGLGDTAEQIARKVYDESDSIGLGDLPILSYSIRCADTVAFNDTLDVYARVIAAVTDTLGAGDSIAMTGNMAFSIADALGIGDTGALNASMAFDLDDSIGMWVAVKLGDDVYYGYAVNAETAATSTYTNYAFNSFFELDGRHYGVTSTGIYYLDGADDAGTAISAAIRTGVTDLGTKRKKRLPRAYVGFTSDGSMVLKTLTDDKVERWYSLAQSDDTYNIKRAKLGRGVDFSYLQMELVNVDGADFEIDSLSLMPIVLQRRIN